VKKRKESYNNSHADSTLNDIAGFMTSKGELIRAILFPKPIHFRFYADLIQVAILFLVFGLGGMIFSMYTWIRNGVRIAVTTQ
jgi:hypothetical protein